MDRRVQGYVLLLAGMLLTVMSVESAQGQNVIEENPSGAVKLRRIWYKLGTGVSGPAVGRSAVGIGDLNGDGADEFSVRVGSQEFIYLGGDSPSHEPARVIDSAGSPVKGPVIGDFFGTGEKLCGYPRSRSLPNGGAWYEWLFFYRQDDDSLLVLTEHVLETGEQACDMVYLAADLDGDGADELIVGVSCYQPEVWIYRGGADFDLSAPTLKIVDSAGVETLDRFHMAIARVDNDEHLDLVYGVRSSLANERSGYLKFWWGGDDTPWTWTNEPDRVIEQPVGTVVPGNTGPRVLQDVDGDGVMDWLVTISIRDGAYLWRSRDRESARTRPFDSTDYDDVFPGMSRTRGFGYMADSLGRYEMLALLSNSGGPAYGFVGGANGPNHTYDAEFGGGEGPNFGGWPAGDINGDGWQDRILFSPTYGGPGVGIALILAGGPYIPVDDPTVSVREEPIAGESGGLYLWPNPVAGDELHVAWKRKLSSLPSRFAVYDMDGREIVSGDVDARRGVALWRCGSVPRGSYLLVVSDAGGNAIGSATIVRE